MSTTAKHVKGSILQYVEETTFGEDPEAGYKDLMINGDPSISGQFSNALNPETLFANPNYTEKPILVDTAVEGAVSFSVGLTRAAAGSDAQLVALMESAGWEEDSGSDTTVDTATSQTSIILDADQGDPGRGLIVQLGASASGNFWPVLVSSKSTTEVTFACGLPSVTAAGNPVNQCHTFYPGTYEPVSTSLTLRHITKALNSTDQVMSVFTGCSAAQIGDLEITPGTIPYLEFTMNVAAHGVEELTGFPANDFNDNEGKKPCDGAMVQIATASASGGIASATYKLLSATIGFGSTTEMIPGIGDAECINNIQGHMQSPGEFTGTLRVLYDSAKTDDWEGTNTSKYIGVVQPSANTTQPPWAFIMPNAHITEISWEPYAAENMQVMVLKYKANPAGYNSEDAEGDKANQPIYFLLGTESA